MTTNFKQNSLKIVFKELSTSENLIAQSFRIPPWTLLHKCLIGTHHDTPCTMCVTRALTKGYSF